MTYKLSEIAYITSGMAFSSDNADDLGLIPVITSSNLLADSILSDFTQCQTIKSLPTRSPAIVNDNDVLMVSRATPGRYFKACLVKTKQALVATSSIYILRAQTKFILPEFLNHYVNSSAFQKSLYDNVKGSTIFHVSKKALGDIVIPVPSLKEQKVIIALRNSINQQISIHKRQQELKEQAMQAVLKNLYNNGNNYGNDNTARA